LSDHSSQKNGVDQRGILNRWWCCSFWRPSETMDGQRTSRRLQNLFEIPQSLESQWKYCIFLNLIHTLFTFSEG